MPKRPPARILSVRLPAASNAWLERTARKRQRSKSDLVRDLIEAERQKAQFDVEGEARRQSLLVSRRPSEREALEFANAAADEAGWK